MNEEEVSSGQDVLVVNEENLFRNSENSSVIEFSDERFVVETTTTTSNMENDAVEVPYSISSTNIENDSPNQAVPEMIEITDTQPSTSTDETSPNEGIILIFDPEVSTADQQEIIDQLNNQNLEETTTIVSNLENELQVVPDNNLTSMKEDAIQSVEITSQSESSTSNTELQTVPTVGLIREMEIPTQQVELSTWEEDKSTTGGDVSGMSLLSSVASEKQTLETDENVDVTPNLVIVDSENKEEFVELKESQPRMVAYDSNTGEFVEVRGLDDENGQVTYILHDEDGEEGTAYQIVTDEQFRQMQTVDENEIEEEEEQEENETELSTQNETEDNTSEQFVLENEGMLQLTSTTDEIREETQMMEITEPDNQQFIANSPVEILGIPDDDVDETETEVHLLTDQTQQQQPTVQTPQVIDLGPAASLISSDNVQALLQILQALPLQGQGQTVQIVLQGTPNENSTTQEAGVYQLSTSDLNEIGEKQEVVQLMTMPTTSTIPTTKRKTTDTAVQATLDPTGRRGPGYRIRAINEQMDLIQMDPDSSRHAYAPRRFRQRQSTAPRRTLVRASTSSFYYNVPTSDGEDSNGENQTGVSYYAIMDYLSEIEGYSSAQESTTQLEGPKSDFMEDYLELLQHQDGDGRNLLSSTLDETVVTSPFPKRKGKYKVLAVSHPGSSIDLPENSQSSVTLPARTFEQVTLDGRSLAEYTNDELDPLSRPPRYTRGLRTLPRRMIHRCAYCEYESRDKLLVSQHCHGEHPENNVRILTLVPECSRRQCPYCKQKFNYAEFFQHMRYAHNDVHPFKCYYCDFQGRDRNQVKHHICKKHAKPTRIINLMRDDVLSTVVEGKKKIMTVSEGEESVYEYLTEDDEDGGGEWEDGVKRNLTCPECKKSFKSLKYLKTHIKMHRPHRFQCGYCDYIATLEHQILKHSLRKHGTAEPRVVSKELEPEKNPLISRDIDSVVRRVFSMSLRQPKDDDPMTWARKWTCPHCDYTCQFGASFRRHIRMHANLLPYKCNYCSFKGREKYYVRRHIARMHRGLPEIVVDNTAENRAGDTSSDEDYQEKGLRRRRKRKVKNVLKAVMPVGGAPVPPDVHVVVKRGGRCGEEGEEEDEEESAYEEEVVMSGQYGRTVCGGDEKWISEFCGSREGENIVCKVCKMKVHARAFQKHAMKHRQQNQFGCGYCNYTASERSKVRVHISYHHPSMPFKVLVDGKEKIQHFQCPICQQQLVVGEESALREHFYVHYDFKPFRCRQCDTRASSREMILAHGTVEHGEVVEVDVLEEAPPNGLEDTIQQFLHEVDVPAENVEIVDVVVGDDAKPTPPVKRRRGRPPKTDRGATGRFECPICRHTMQRHAATVRRHLYNHFDYKPYICGYCGFRSFTDNEVRQHNAMHGKVPAKVSIADERMPAQLENLLSTVNDELRVPGPAKFPAASDPNSLVTDEGRRWHDALVKGVCPWCEEFVGHFRPTAYRHLKTHFQCRPYRCGHCGHRGSERNEIKLHSASAHPGDAVAVVGPSIKMVEIEQGLKRYLQGRPSVLEKIREEENVVEEEVVVIMDIANGGGGGGESEEAVKELVASEGVKEGSMDVDKGEKKDILNVENEILEVEDSGTTLLVRNFRPENNDSSQSGDELMSTNVSMSNVIQVPVDLLEDVCYLLQLSCLPQDVPLTRRKLNWHRCTQCKRKFRKASTLRDHVNSEHKSDKTSYNCFYCNYWNYDKTFVKNHIENGHPGRRVLMKERVVLKQRSILKRNAENESENEENLKKSKMEDDEVSSEPPLKRKRGRPPKMAAVSDLGGDDAKEINVILQVDSTSIKTSVKRGRQRKVQLQPTITMPPGEETVNDVDDVDKMAMVVVKCTSPIGEVISDQSGLIDSSTIEKISTDDVIQDGGVVNVNDVQLEGLEECDENLPKVLHILNL